MDDLEYHEMSDQDLTQRLRVSRYSSVDAIKCMHGTAFQPPLHDN